MKKPFWKIFLKAFGSYSSLIWLCNGFIGGVVIFKWVGGSHDSGFDQILIVVSLQMYLMIQNDKKEFAKKEQLLKQMQEDTAYFEKVEAEIDRIGRRLEDLRQTLNANAESRNKLELLINAIKMLHQKN